MSPIVEPKYNMKKYRVEWKFLKSNISSHGDWFNSKQFIKDWVDYGNKNWGYEIIHWIGEK